MNLEKINTGSGENRGDGDTLINAMGKINRNFEKTNKLTSFHDKILFRLSFVSLILNIFLAILLFLKD